MSRTADSRKGGRPPACPSDDPRLHIVFLSDGRLLVRVPRSEQRVRAVAQRMWERGWRLSEAEPEGSAFSVLWFVRRICSKHKA